jgi:Flp pilus assembly pilin Flp
MSLSLRDLVRCERASASVEYVVVLATVTLVAALIVVTWGPSLLRFFQLQRAWLLLPLP